MNLAGMAPVCLLSEMFRACPAQTSGYNQGKLEKLCLQTAQGAPWIPMEKLKEVAAEKRFATLATQIFASCGKWINE